MTAVAEGGGAAATRTAVPLPSYALFAAMLAMAGLPIYIHAPKFYVDSYGVGLSALGAVLFVLRLLDVVQDPLLGWVAQATVARRRLAVTIGGVAIALSMVGLFAVTPPVAPLLWFALTLTVLFSAFSFLTICFYAQGVRTAERLGADGHVRLAGWREAGALLGVCLAAVLPVGLLVVSDDGFGVFALLFAGLVVLAFLLMRHEWGGVAPPASGASDFRTVLRDEESRRLLLIALLNATPVAVSSTLFLFFVESRLEAPGWEGPLLLLFFLSAAVAAPVWARLARRFGIKPVLLTGMVLAVVAFVFTAFLGAGDAPAFALVCIASGAALGADMTLIAALFARRLSRLIPEAAAGFGLYAFVTKVSLAVAAATLLPALEWQGFVPGGENDIRALMTLTVLYALVPCGLKLAAIYLLVRTPVDED